MNKADLSRLYDQLLANTLDWARAVHSNTPYTDMVQGGIRAQFSREWIARVQMGDIPAYETEPDLVFELVQGVLRVGWVCGWRGL